MRFHLPSHQVFLLSLSFPFSPFFFFSCVVLSFPCLNYPVISAIAKAFLSRLSRNWWSRRDSWGTLSFLSLLLMLYTTSRGVQRLQMDSQLGKHNRKNTTGDVGGEARLTYAPASQSGFGKTLLLKIHHEKAVPCTRSLRNATAQILFWGDLQRTWSSTTIVVCPPAETLVELLSARSLDTEPIRWHR